MDTLGAIVGPATAFVLLPWVGHHYPTLFALTLIPGLLAEAAITFQMKGSELYGKASVRHNSAHVKRPSMP